MPEYFMLVFNRTMLIMVILSLKDPIIIFIEKIVESLETILTMSTLKMSIPKGGTPIGRK